MNVMLLAAGRSTRLGALGAELPKPLVPVCGYPVIRFGLEACRRAELGEVVVNLHHHADLVREVLGDGSRFGTPIRWSDEPELLGTGGGIVNARHLFGGGPLLVMNAKVVADVDLALVVAAHRASGAVATMLVREDPDARTWGPIAVDEAHRVVGILDARSPRPPQGQVVEHMFTGIHVIEMALVDRLAPGPSDVIRQAYIPALEAGAEIRALRLEGHFAEHSTPERYLAGNLALLRRPSLVPHPPGPLVGVDAAAMVDDSAMVDRHTRAAPGAVVEAGTVLVESVVCEGAVVSAGARLSHVVVWPGARAKGTLADGVVTRAGFITSL